MLCLSVKIKFFFVLFSGVLTTTKSLDRESISQYNLVVNATDSGGQVGVIFQEIRRYKQHCVK